MPNGTSQAFFTGTRRASNDLELYRNGSSIATSAFTPTSDVSTNTRPIFVLACNAIGTAADFSARNVAFVSLGTGLTDTDASNFYTAVQNMQTTLARQV